MDLRLADAAGSEPGAIEEPLGAVPLHDRVAVEAQAKANEIRDELRLTRRILTGDDMVNLNAPRARHERSFSHLEAHFFSIDGVLGSQKVQGALFAGECMLVRGRTEREAQELANQGLRKTIDLLREEFETRNSRLLNDPVVKGLQLDAAGKKVANADPNRPLLANNPKLKAIIATEIGGLPWTY